MELESLKYMWHTLETPPAPAQHRDDILALMEKRSRGPVAKMRRNLLRELILVGATYIPTILFYLFDFKGKLSGIAWLLLLLLVVFAGYFYRKNRLLTEMQCISCRVRSNLQRQVSTLRKYIRFYTITGTLMIPFMAVFSVIIIHWKLPSSFGSVFFYRLSGAAWWKSPVFWGMLLVPVTIGIYYVNVWYVNKLYGRHIRKLQEILAEMEEE